MVLLSPSSADEAAKKAVVGPTQMMALVSEILGLNGGLKKKRGLDYGAVLKDYA